MIHKPKYTFEKDEYDASYNIFKDSNFIGHFFTDPPTIDKFIHCVNTHAALVDALEKALETIEIVEWEGDDDHGQLFCPWCSASYPDLCYDGEYVHEDKCQRQQAITQGKAALAAAKGEK